MWHFPIVVAGCKNMVGIRQSPMASFYSLPRDRSHILCIFIQYPYIAVAGYKGLPQVSLSFQSCFSTLCQLLGSATKNWVLTSPPTTTCSKSLNLGQIRLKSIPNDSKFDAESKNLIKTPREDDFWRRSKFLLLLSDCRERY